MNRSGDAASCAALAADLHRGAARLRTCPDAGDEPDVGPLADDLDALADALSRFATALRDPAPIRSGRPFPHTALHTALRGLSTRG